MSTGAGFLFNNSTIIVIPAGTTLVSLIQQKNCLEIQHGQLFGFKTWKHPFCIANMSFLDK